MRQRVPLIWFFDVGMAVWKPVYPIYVRTEQARQQQFFVDPDVARNLVETGSPIEDDLRRYIVAETRRRLRKPVSRHHYAGIRNTMRRLFSCPRRFT